MNTTFLAFDWVSAALRPECKATPIVQPVSVGRDDQIRQALLDRLGQQPWWDAEVSNVYVENGVVVIQGLITNPSTSRLARKLAVAQPGVRSVHDARRPGLQWLG